MKSKALVIIILAVVLVACAPTSTPMPTSTATDIPQPTATFTPEPTATPTISQISGILFFDMNANGLHDQASFALSVDKSGNLPAIIQKLFPEVTGKNGEVTTFDEPALAGFEICTSVSEKQYCSTTDKNGEFSIKDIPTASGTKVFLKIKDPNAENIELAMKYISQWRKVATVPAYEMNGTKIPEQILNDTELLTITSSIELTTDTQSEIGLTQGYLTLPFSVSDMPNPGGSWNGFDICGTKVYVRDEVASNFLGMNYAGNPYLNPPTDGQLDSHSGLDFAVPEGTLIVASMSGTTISDYRRDGSGELFLDIDNSSMQRRIDNGHLGEWLVKNGTQVLRGQIIAKSGKSGSQNTYMGRFTPQLHWDIAAYGENLYLNPFAILSKDMYPKNCKIMESKNLWAVYNTMVFP